MEMLYKQPTYDCVDEEAIKRFERIVNSWDRRQEISDKIRTE
jgi:hypothetical protein